MPKTTAHRALQRDPNSVVDQQAGLGDRITLTTDERVYAYQETMRFHIHPPVQKERKKINLNARFERQISISAII